MAGNQVCRNLAIVPIDEWASIPVSPVSLFGSHRWNFTDMGSPIYQYTGDFPWSDSSEHAETDPLAPENEERLIIVKALAYYHMPHVGIVGKARSYTSMVHVIAMSKYLVRLFAQHGLYNGARHYGTRRTINTLDATQLTAAIERDLNQGQRYMAGRLLRAWYELSNAGLLPADYQIVFEPIDKKTLQRWIEAWHTSTNPYQPIPVDTLSRLVSGAIEWVESYAEHVIFAYQKFLPYLASRDAMSSALIDDFRLQDAIAVVRAHPSPAWTLDDLAFSLHPDGRVYEPEVMAFLNTISYRLRDACINIVLATTGIRAMELAMLEEGCAWDASKRGDYVLSVRVWKTSDASQGDETKLPIPEITFKAIEVLTQLGAAARQHHGTRRLIVALTRFSRTRWGEPAGKTIAGYSARAFAAHLGITDHIHPHQYRKTLAMFVIYQDPEHLELIRHLFSHKSLRMTLAYITSIPHLSDDVRYILIQHHKDLLRDMIEACDEGKVAGKAGLRIKASLAAARISPASLLDNGQDTLSQYIEALAIDGSVALHRTPWAVICTKAPSMIQRAPCDRPKASRHRRLTPDVSRCDPIRCPFAVFTEETIPYLTREIAFHDWLRAREGCSSRQVEVSSLRIRECRLLLAELAADDGPACVESTLGEKARDDG